MARKIKQILELTGQDGLLFASWMTRQGLDSKQQFEHIQSGWLARVARGVYKIAGSHPTLYSAVSCYNIQLGKQCIVGARSAFEIRGMSHYVPMGKPVAYLFTDNNHKLPDWLLQGEWDMTVRYQTTSFLGEDLLGVQTMTVEGRPLLVSSAERAMLEWLNMPGINSSLLDVYYVMEMLSTLRPKLIQQLLERCTSVKAKRLFMYMAEKTHFPWVEDIDKTTIDFGSGRRMIVPTGKYIKQYDMTVPKDLAEYE
ncbi:MAG: type IV toxin-antitoxin system AbiEi family antitoxin [Paludibacteraceae bacterium]|nr:type IV toxin-antitoxin system AbiEi family antitoxin [Paludibacteraceae bacterium]